MKKTKIVCTIGPISESKEMLEKLLKNGMNVMRLNFSHGNHEEHAKRITNLRAAIDSTGIRAAILLDTKGPEIRTIKLKNGEDVFIKEGQEFTFTTDTSFIGDNKKVAVTYEGFTKDLKAGNIVLLDDGLIELLVKKVTDTEVICIAKNSGYLGENKGVNLPGVVVNLPALAEKDKDDLRFGCEQGVDFVAASFIRRASDVMEVRKVLNENKGQAIRIISKIENQEGLDNFEEILKASDGIMVARGDLGVEIPVEDVPFAQKMMISQCNEVGKVVITATQMLDSMIKNPRPTRAEANDVANAIIDGTDAVMLSGETAKGAYSVESVAVMNKIACKTDPLIEPLSEVILNSEGLVSLTSAVSKGTADISEILNAKLIVVGTATGRAARNLRRYFPSAEILAITNSEKTANQLMLSRGIIPYVYKDVNDLDSFFKLSAKIATELNLVKEKDIIVVTCGEKVFKSGTTNSIKVIEISK